MAPPVGVLETWRSTAQGRTVSIPAATFRRRPADADDLRLVAGGLLAKGAVAGYKRRLAMTATLVLLLGSSLFFAVNMGGSGLAPAFSVAIGAGMIRRVLAVGLFTLFVTAGALLLGSFVAKTLGSGLVSPEAFDPSTALCVIGAAAVALFGANLLKIPQSTSWVTVAAISVVGLRGSDLNTDTILYRLLPAWIGLPFASFAITYAIARLFYPVRGSNVRAFEGLSRHAGKLRALVLITACYVALAIGSNNVANVVGPLAASGAIDMVTGFVVVAPLFGLGAALLPAPSQTMGRIVPLGMVTAAITSLVTGSVLLFASWKGIPQSLVHVNAAALAAMSLAKEGSWQLMRRELFQRIGLLWLITPLIAAAMTAIFLAVRG